MNIQEIRTKYPQYSDMSDSDLASALHKKYYADMPFADFSAKIGFAQKPAPIDPASAIGEAQANPEASVLGMKVQGETASGFNPAAYIIGAGQLADKVYQGYRQADTFGRYALKRLTGGGQAELDSLAAQKESEAEKDRQFAKLQTVHPGSTQLGQITVGAAVPMRALPVVAGMEYGDAGDRALKAGSALLGNKLTQKVGQFAANKAEDSARQIAQSAPVRELADQAREAGFSIPPTQTNPNILNRALEGFAGKLTTAQQASAKNTNVVGDLIREEFSLPKNAPLNAGTFDKIRAEAGKSYRAVKDALPVIYHDDSYKAALTQIAEKYGAADSALANKQVLDLIKRVDVEAMPTARMVEEIKRLRFHGGKNLKAFDDPGRAELGKAQREIADAMENLIDLNLQARTETGSGLIDAYRKARVDIAKAWSAQDALNETTGTLSLREFGKMLDKGVPLSGNMRKAGEFARAFPKASQEVEKMGSLPGMSPLDYGAALVGGIGGSVTGNPFLAVAPFARPVARAGILSGPYQRTIGAAGESPDWITIQRLLDNRAAQRAGGLLGFAASQ